jgi:hypothetical protein
VPALQHRLFFYARQRSCQHKWVCPATSNERGIKVTVTPQSIPNEGMFNFEVTLETHNQPWAMTAKSAVLTDGNHYCPWPKVRRRGHHCRPLRFKAIVRNHGRLNCNCALQPTLCQEVSNGN